MKAPNVSPRAKGRVLVVEDDPALGTGLRRNLEFDRYEVRLAATGQEALDLVRSFHPQVVVLDIMLPDISGFDVLEQLSSIPGRPEVIILSALGREEDKVRGLKLGADDYMSKPFSLAEFLARVEAAIRRSERAIGMHSEIEIGPLVVDRQSHTVRRSGRDVRLTAREFELFLALIDARGRVLSREELLRLVWGWDYEGTARTVDNFIRNLRKKIEDDPAEPRWIQTVHGVGYRFAHHDSGVD